MKLHAITMLKSSVLPVMLMLTAANAAALTVDPDSTEKAKLRRFSARNFSEQRTLNLHWETSPAAHDYTLKRGDDVLERGRIRDDHVIKFTTVIPVVDKRRFTLNAKLHTNFYKFDANTDAQPTLMKTNADDTYSYYGGGLEASYVLNVGHRPLVVRGAVSKPISSGYYKTNRKGDGHGTPVVSNKAPFTPFIYLGFSYNLFK